VRIGLQRMVAAEGTIDENAHRRLHGLLNRLDRRKLPIYFHAPGGSLEAAMAIGRMMRERGITAGVGRTVPRGCDPLQEHEAACDSLKRSGRELLAELRTARTLCNSACVYALIGARVREVGAGARIGVHEIAISRYDERGLPVPVDRKSLSQAQLKHLQAAEVQLARYIGGMGIDKALFDAAAQIGHERVRYLSLNEIARFGIDPREFHESRWMTDEGPPGPLAVLKFVVEAKGGAPKDYRTTLIRLTCGRPGELRVAYSREVLSGPAGIDRRDHARRRFRAAAAQDQARARLQRRPDRGPARARARRLLRGRGGRRCHRDHARAGYLAARQAAAGVAALPRRAGGVDRYSGEAVPPVSSVRMAAVLACGLASAVVPAAAAPQAPATPSTLGQPMVFFVAKGEPDACGAGCGEWIAAEGEIDAGTPQRLRALLVRLEDRRLPIFFHSPGGQRSAALEIGRLLRQKKMTAEGVEDRSRGMRRGERGELSGLDAVRGSARSRVG
jgi:hypothetical protein